MPRDKTIRVEFTGEHDSYLVKYLATYCPTKEGRSGRKIFENLVANENKHKWPWAIHHPWQSWRERYVKNSVQFDRLILKYQQKHDTKSVETRKRPAGPMSTEVPRPSAKRAKLEEGELSFSSETSRPTRRDHTNSPRSKSTATSPPKHAREPPATPLQPPNSTHLTSPRRTMPPSPSRFNANVSTNATEKPAVAQMRDETLAIPSSLPDQQALFAPEPRSPPRHVKRTKVRLATPSDIFASEPPSPRLNTPVPACTEGPSSQAQPTPVPASVHPRAPPRVVDSLHGQVLVDREGHIPPSLPREEKHGDEEEGEQGNEAQSPPARGRTTEQERASEPDVETAAHHAFSQLQPPPPPEAPSGRAGTGEREQAKPPLDRRTVADLFAGPARPFPRAQSEPRDDVVRNGTSPVKRVVTAAPPADPFSGRVPKVFKFPAPRASTQSPFRPESPAKETRRPPLSPEPRPPSWTKVARHPELARVRRQTISNGDGRQREVPSVDLVALSHSSISARSHSHSSAATSIPVRPSRWSLPAFAHATPWVFREPFSVHGDPWHDRARTSSPGGMLTPRFTLAPSPVGSIAGMVSDPSASLSLANGVQTHASPSVSLTPHPPDVQLTASHGLASILAHMSVNHGLALDVVKAVYKRVGSLREADEVLKGMREAAEGFGEREIERRVKGRRGERGEGVGWGRVGRASGGGAEQGRSASGSTELRYVVASDDGEGSEYSPPETSRAAMWKRQSESSYAGEEGGDEADDEEAEEGRAVEEELRDLDEHEDDGEEGTHHDFSRHVPLEGENTETGQDRNENDGTQDGMRRQGGAWTERRMTEALLEDTRLAQKMERKLGKGRYRRDITRLFG